MSIETQSKVTQDSRSEVDKIVVTEGENLGRIEDISVAQNTASLLNMYRGNKAKADTELEAERETAGTREFVEHLVANEVMNRVGVRPVVAADKEAGVYTDSFQYHPETDSDVLSESYKAAEKRMKEIQKQVEEK